MHMFGILNIHKPVGMTSREAVNYVVRCLPRKTKVGHAGTLDPIAEGVLVVCVGSATRLIQYVHQYPKSYIGTFKLGESSPSEDIEGEITVVDLPDSVTQESLHARRSDFLGDIQQVPPIFSAVKVKGRRAYDVARSGTEFELVAKTVQIHQLAFAYEKPVLTIEVECGTGTYIRSLGRDIARSVGSEAVMYQLVRTAVGPFVVAESVSLDALSAENVQSHLQSPLGILTHLPKYVANQSEIDSLQHGRFVVVAREILDGLSETWPMVIVDQSDQLVALGINRNGQLAPHLVFPAE